MAWLVGLARGSYPEDKPSASGCPHSLLGSELPLAGSWALAVGLRRTPFAAMSENAPNPGAESSMSSPGAGSSTPSRLQQAWSAIGTALNLSPHPTGRKSAPPSTGRSRTPATQLRTQFDTPRTKAHEGLLLTMMGIDPDIKEVAWADRMLMQLEPYSQEEATWRASYSEAMITDLLDQARNLVESQAGCRY